MSHVMIVEDEAVLRMTFQEFLEEDGYVVAAAANYEEAVTELDDQDYDVIVTDIILSERTGVDLLRTVYERGLRTQVIMITGEPNVDTAAEAVRLGAFDYLAKPVTGDQLKRVVRLALDRKRLKEERDLYAARVDMYRRDLEAVFNSVKEGIVTVDAAMRVRQVNQAAESVLALPPNWSEGEYFTELMADQLKPARDALMETLATHKPVTDVRIELDGADGPEKTLIVNTVPLLSEGGVYAGAVLVIRDITRLTLLEQQLEDSTQYRNMVGKNARIREIFSLIDDLAETDSTVLICGESGTGKELVAAALHNASPRAKGPFIRVNCAALSEDILESELFGHVKGAFTGALKDRVGRFEAANGGTILLDEIGDISPRLQLRLLRVLQEHEFERVGDSHPIRTDVRVIASTNQDLVQKIRLGEFREDLYYRLNVVRIEIPPLRDRRDDIPLLVDFLRRRFNRVFKKEITGLAEETLEILMTYPWYGNVRELENCLERAFIVCREPVIQPKHLPPEVRNNEHVNTAPALPSHTAGRLKELTKDEIRDVLNRTDWNVAKSARQLGVARNTLYQKMRAYKLTRPRSY